ncbi:hypothetical protein [Xanthocytophaga agilis]|uniref:Uncharacterized protein n=1 Tax=Xanthocytophaga agilis TaxID=3048010 RepID=A0AAE3R049_9BACT|nr:hypothetical protein [Xanthocytophaga agilis]MDJ1500690.1 hypothetical protein [Xanthocytophaga agilis]
MASDVGQYRPKMDTRNYPHSSKIQADSLEKHFLKIGKTFDQQK